MFSRRLLAIAAVCLYATGTAATRQGAAIGPVSPVTPKPSALSAYDNRLETLLEADSDDKLWNSSNQSQRDRMLRSVQQLTIEIYGLPVGPVVPKPSAPPKPAAAATTKTLWDNAFKDLRTAVDRASTAAPALQVPPATARELEALIQRLSTGKPE